MSVSKWGMFACRNCGLVRNYAYSRISPDGIGTHRCRCGWFIWRPFGGGYRPVGK